MSSSGDYECVTTVVSLYMLWLSGLLSDTKMLTMWKQEEGYQEEEERGRGVPRRDGRNVGREIKDIRDITYINAHQ